MYSCPETENGNLSGQDLTKIGELIRSRTYEMFFPLIAAARINFALALVPAQPVRRINVIADPHRRYKKKILRGIKTQ